MGFISIKKQIVQILQTLTYKAYGFQVHYPWPRAQLIKNTQQDKIGYKIPIPNIIYTKYSEDGFIYSDPGTTPRQIAQDILTHFKSLNHLQMQSDQFGNILGYVKQRYFQQICQQIIKSNKIRCRKLDELGYHQNQSIKLLNNEQEIEAHNNKQLMMVMFRKNNHMMNLSQLRQQYVLGVIKNIQKSIFNRQVQIINVFSKPSADDHKNNLRLNKFNTSTHQLLYSSLSHQLIENERRLHKLLSVDGREMVQQQQSSVQLIKFGIVVPQEVMVRCCAENKCNNSNSNNNSITPLTTEQIFALKSIIFDHSLLKPIHLALIKHLNTEFHSLLSKHLLTLPLNVEQLILKIDQLTSQHKINQLYHLYLMINHLVEKSKITTQIQEKNIQCKDKRAYLAVAKVVAKHLREIFYQ